MCLNSRRLQLYEPGSAEYKIISKAVEADIKDYMHVTKPSIYTPPNSHTNHTRSPAFCMPTHAHKEYFMNNYRTTTAFKTGIRLWGEGRSIRLWASGPLNTEYSDGRRVEAIRP